HASLARDARVVETARVDRRRSPPAPGKGQSGLEPHRRRRGIEEGPLVGLDGGPVALVGEARGGRSERPEERMALEESAVEASIGDQGGHFSLGSRFRLDMPGPPSVLFVASECAHFVKAGGLGDVVGGLPVALRALGHDARIVIPRYDVIPAAGLTRHAAPLGVPLGGSEMWASVMETTLPGTDVPVYLLDHERLFGRGYLYDPPGSFAPDNLIRFAFLSRGAIQLCKHLGWTPDVFHVHDWPSALVPIYLNTELDGMDAQGALGRAASVLTIHNLAHQAKFSARDLPSTHVPWSELRPDGLEDFGGVNPLKGGLYHATKLTTVSPRYAVEIKTPEGGAGLDP